MPETNFNETQLQQIIFNGIDLDKVYFNDVTVFEKYSTTYEIYVS